MKKQKNVLGFIKREEKATADQARFKAVGFSQASTTNSKLPMRMMLFLNVDMYQAGDFVAEGPVVSC